MLSSVDLFELMRSKNDELKHAKGNRLPEWKWTSRQHVDPIATKELRILAVTWNMYGTFPEEDVIKQLVRPDIMHDLVVVATQECMCSLAKSLLNPNKEPWVQRLSTVLGQDYIMLTSHSLQGMHLVVFCWQGILKLVTNIRKAHVATGMGNKMGNKGSVGISFDIGVTSFLFLCCHLASGHSQQEHRNKSL